MNLSVKSTTADVVQLIVTRLLIRVRGRRLEFLIIVTRPSTRRTVGLSVGVIVIIIMLLITIGAYIRVITSIVVLVFIMIISVIATDWIYVCSSLL